MMITSFLILLWTYLVVMGQSIESGIAKTTRYWDCCKGTCAWSTNVPNLASGFSAVRTCALDGSDADSNDKSICGGGGGAGVSYMCTDQSPWTENGIMYGFAAGSFSCCTCYEVTFLGYSVDENGNRCSGCSSYNGQLENKKMILQVTNSGGDLSKKHFDIMIPGGGFGIFNGCASNNEGVNGPPQFDTPYQNWGERYGGVRQKADCSGLPDALKPGCLWRFDDWLNADNPGVSYTRVECPSQLTEKSKCKLNTDPISGPTVAPGPTTTPAPTTAPPPTGNACKEEAEQCYGKPGSGSSCGGNNGYCGSCCPGLQCGGTAEDNEWWKGCRVKTNTVTDSPTPRSVGTPSPTTNNVCKLEAEQCYGKPGSDTVCGGNNGYCGSCCPGLQCGGTEEDNEWWKGCRLKTNTVTDAPTPRSVETRYPTRGPVKTPSPTSVTDAPTPRSVQTRSPTRGPVKTVETNSPTSVTDAPTPGSVGTRYPTRGTVKTNSPTSVTDAPTPRSVQTRSPTRSTSQPTNTSGFPTPVCTQEGKKCYGKPDSSYFCGGTNGYCGSCCDDLQCGGSMKDTENVKYCRDITDNSANTSTNSPTWFPANKAYGVQMSHIVVCIEILMIFIRVVYWR